MGTRADFYVGRGEQAEWLGSIAWDGYPSGIPDDLLRVNTESNYREWVTQFLAKREDATLPKHGWPWPWETSHTTDYAYAFDDAAVWGCCYGHKWFLASEPEPEDHGDAKEAVFPDMSKRQRVTFGKRSGLMVFQAP